MPCDWGVNAGMVRVWVAGRLCDPLVTRGPYLSALEIRILYIKCYINSPSLLFSLFIKVEVLMKGIAERQFLFAV